MRKSHKILTAVAALIIIAGVVIISIAGFNLGAEYDASKRIQLNIAKEFETSDVKQIAKSVFGNKSIEVKKVELFEDVAYVNVKDATDEEMETFITKMNEAYGLDYTLSQADLLNIPKIDFIDIVKPYLIPISIAMAGVLAYMAIRYRKMGVIKAILLPFANCLAVQVLFFSLLAITRIPFTSYVMPIATLILIITLTATVAYFEYVAKEKITE